MPVASPCIRTCVLDERSGLCQGCGRSLAEIAAWAAMDDAQRRAVLARLPGRKAALARPVP